jgi:hypothetical protein
VLDCSFGAVSLGFVNRDEQPITWAERFVDVFANRRDPQTTIWSDELNRAENTNPPPAISREADIGYGSADFLGPSGL